MLKNVMQKIEDTRNNADPRYSVRATTIKEVVNASNDFFELFSNSFALGYLQGMKAAKAEMKRGQ